MNAMFWFRIIVGLFFGLLIIHDVFPKWYIRNGEKGVRRYWRFAPLGGADLIPLVIMALLCVSLPKWGWVRTVERLGSFGVNFLLNTSLYYLLLRMVMKPLRRKNSARGCALLWIVPSYLWIIFYWAPPMEPWLVLQVDSQIVWVVVLVWFVGFAGVWGWKVAEDIRFRREIMTGARDVTDPEIQRLWHEELEKTGYEIQEPRHAEDNPKAPLYAIWKGIVALVQPEPKPEDLQGLEIGLEKVGLRKMPIDETLVISPHVKTPLTIGGRSRFFMRIVLPERDYTLEEMALILRHEVVHVFHGDSANKRFLVFCKALCWFNPLMWIAMRRSAEDLELCCDEAVLLGEDEQTRRQYAELILRTAGDERGFTTCLSASASALRYRLKSIVRPRKVKNGVLAVCIAFVLLFMSFGYVTLGFDASTGAQAVFGGVDVTAFQISTIHLSGEDGGYLECASPEALTRYLAGLPMSRLAGDYASEGAKELTVVYYGPRGSFGVTLEDRMLTISPMYEEAGEEQQFYISEAVDWGYVLSLLSDSLGRD